MLLPGLQIGQQCVPLKTPEWATARGSHLKDFETTFTKHTNPLSLGFQLADVELNFPSTSSAV